MTRHSKHSNDRTFFTAKERKDAGFAGTRKDVLGTDAMLPFGFCALSLKAPRDPVATPEGHVFDREVIMKYLLEQKLELQAHQKKFDEQERRKDRKVQAANQKGDMKELEDFLQADQGLLSQDARHKRALENAGSDPRTCKKVRGDELLARDGEFKNQMRKECFWAKENAHSAAPTELKKMDLATKCPMTGKKLKLKDLIPIKFEVADQKLVDQGGGRGMYCCAVSKDPIIFQQALLIKPSGVVVLETVWKGILSKEGVCPVTGKKIKEEDVLKIIMGGSGFSSHNETQAKSFSLVRSRFGDDRTQAGHLPKAGYVGLH